MCALEKAEVTTPFEPPEVFVAKGRDGTTDIWGLIFRPHNLDASKKYPILEDIYSGPQGAFVPKSFRPGNQYQELNNLGFIVVKIDGMGTANRSKAFHDVCWKNLKDGGFLDRIAWIKDAAKKYPYMDLDRVGIYGTSAGGQNAAAAVLFHPEFYKVAVANSGCHDNRMDKVSWNEQWMGYPIGPQYSECSNIDNAGKLQGHLQLVVGELDTNVPPESTYRFVNALVQAGKDFEFVMIPGADHGRWIADHPHQIARLFHSVPKRRGTTESQCAPRRRVIEFESQAASKFWSRELLAGESVRRPERLGGTSEFARGQCSRPDSHRGRA